jgi:hypothetical protein
MCNVWDPCPPHPGVSLAPCLSCCYTMQSGTPTHPHTRTRTHARAAPGFVVAAFWTGLSYNDQNLAIQMDAELFYLVLLPPIIFEVGVPGVALLDVVVRPLDPVRACTHHHHHHHNPFDQPQGGYTLSKIAFFQNFPLIALLAFLGAFYSTMITSILMYFFSKLVTPWSFVESLVFGRVAAVGGRGADT